VTLQLPESMTTLFGNQVDVSLTSNLHYIPVNWKQTAVPITCGQALIVARNLVYPTFLVSQNTQADGESSSNSESEDCEVDSPRPRVEKQREVIRSKTQKVKKYTQLTNRPLILGTARL
jgi:hypothetical protein